MARPDDREVPVVDGAILVAPSRSAKAISEASVPPSPQDGISGDQRGDAFPVLAVEAGDFELAAGDGGRQGAPTEPGRRLNRAAPNCGSVRQPNCQQCARPVPGRRVACRLPVNQDRVLRRAEVLAAAQRECQTRWVAQARSAKSTGGLFASGVGANSKMP
jgi:hypothetical protein